MNAPGEAAQRQEGAPGRTPVVLLAGTGLRSGRSLALEAAAAAGPAAGPLAVIIEGGPGTFRAPPGVELVQLAPGCVCCMGQLPLRVTVARLLRLVRPARMWIEVGATEHLPELCRQLAGPNFAEHVVVSAARDGENPGQR